MFTNKEAKYLIDLDKRLENPTQIVDLSVNKNTLDLYSPNDKEYKFRLDISSNRKIILKASLHHMESNSHTGLLRIDFKGRHTNPISVNQNVPPKLAKYAGKQFKIDEPHMHIYVHGFRALAWALPLSETNFETKEFKEHGDLSELICSFAKEINLTSKFEIQVGLL